jgi:hypothetical protein
VDIFVQSGPGIDPYFYFLMSDPLVGWQKVWFFVKNDVDVPLPVLTGSCPIPQLKWGYNVTRGRIRSLQPLGDVVQWLL